MIEVEVKIQIPDFSVVRTLLDELGAIKKTVCSRLEMDTYYIHPCRDFSVTDEALRIRTTDGKDHHLTYKGPKLSSKTKTRLEINLRLDNGSLMNEVLEKLGFTTVATIIKRREWWSLDTSNVYLDEVDDLGRFIEIEHEVTNTDNMLDAEEKVFTIIRLLRLDLESATRKSYLELSLEKSQKI